MFLNKQRPSLQGGTQNKYWQTFFFCALAATMIFLPLVIVDGGFFHYAGDFNSQQITFYRYMNAFVKEGGTFSWATDLGSGALNAYSFYLYGSPFFWLSLLLPQSWLPYMMCPLLILKFAVAGGGAYLYLKRYAKDQNYAVIAACLYAFSGFTLYNVFFNHFVDVIATFPYLLWALDRTVHEKKHGWFGILVALNFINNFFFFVGQALFLVIYFLCKLCSGDYKLTPKLFATLATETLLGTGMGAVMAIPAFLSLLQNPRSVDFSSGYGFLMYSSVQQYFAILLSWVMPQDSPYLSSLWDEGVIKWTSMSAYLPVCSLAGVLAYWKARKSNWLKRVLFTCMVFALVPVLNSAFYALNSSFYARWYYMPILMMAAATMMALEDPEIEFSDSTLKVGGIMLATLAFAFIPVFNEAEETWSFGVLQNAGQYVAVLFFGIAGLFLFAWVNEYWRGTAEYPRRLLAVILSFSCVWGITHISIGKFGQWIGDANLVEQYTAALTLKEALPEGEDYRIDTYECYDNLGVWLDKSNLQYFGSTAAPSILEFYPSLGVKRDVSSKPPLKNTALRGLLGVKYTIMPLAEETAFLEDEQEGWTRMDEAAGYAIYENDNYLAMAYALDYYVTPEQLERVTASSRSHVLLRAMVLDDEQIAMANETLSHTSIVPIPDEKLSGLTYDSYTKDITALRTQSCDFFEMTNTGFLCNITLQQDKLVRFAVPYDDGFTATINGEPAEILKVDNGLMATVCSEGENEIVFTYEADGLAESRLLATLCALLFAVYLAVIVYKQKSKSRKNK